jgi:Fe-S cluster biogenesis protein NfuA
MDDLKQRVEHVLATNVAAAVGLDPSALEVLCVENGVVRLRLNGACAGCPATVMAFVQQLEQALRERMPEIEYIEPVP